MQNRYYIKKSGDKLVIKDRHSHHRNVATFTIKGGHLEPNGDTHEDVYKAVDFSDLICNYLNDKFMNVRPY